MHEGIMRFIKNMSSIVLVLLLAACQTSDQEKSEIQIASVLPLTGVAASFGQDMRYGQELAIEYWNSLPTTKRKVLVTFEDSKANPQEGTKIIQRLLAKGYKLFSVVLSNVCMAVKPILADSDAVAFLDASHPGITSPSYPNIFRHSQTAEAEAQALVKEISQSNQIQRIALFHLNDEYGRTLANSFIQQMFPSIKIIKVPYDATTSDFRTVVQSARLDIHDGNMAVVVVGVGKPMGLLIKSMREQGFMGKIFASLGYIVTGARQILGKDRSNIMYTDLRWRDSKATSWMTKQFKNRFSREAPVVAVIEFQTILLFAMAAQDADGLNLDMFNANVKKFAPAVMGVAPTSSNDIFPLVVIKREANE